MGDAESMQGGLIICTDSYSVQDEVRLMNVLIIKYRLDCRLHMSEDRPRIYIGRKSLKLLITIVRLHMVDSMLHKMALSLAPIADYSNAEDQKLTISNLIRDKLPDFKEKKSNRSRGVTPNLVGERVR